MALAVITWSQIFANGHMLTASPTPSVITVPWIFANTVELYSPHPPRQLSSLGRGFLLTDLLYIYSPHPLISRSENLLTNPTDLMFLFVFTDGTSKRTSFTEETFP